MSPAGFRVLWPRWWAGRDDEHMAGRKRQSAEDIVRKLRRADELAAAGNTGRGDRRRAGSVAGDTVQLASRLWRDGPRCGQGAQGIAWAERPPEAVVGRGRVGEGRAARGG